MYVTVCVCVAVGAIVVHHDDDDDDNNDDDDDAAVSLAIATKRVPGTNTSSNVQVLTCLKLRSPKNPSTTKPKGIVRLPQPLAKV